MLVLRLTNFFTKDVIAFYNSILYQNVVRAAKKKSRHYCQIFCKRKAEYLEKMLVMHLSEHI